VTVGNNTAIRLFLTLSPCHLLTFSSPLCAFVPLWLNYCPVPGFETGVPGRRLPAG